MIGHIFDKNQIQQKVKKQKQPDFYSDAEDVSPPIQVLSVLRCLECVEFYRIAWGLVVHRLDWYYSLLTVEARQALCQSGSRGRSFGRMHESVNWSWLEIKCCIVSFWKLNMLVLKKCPLSLMCSWTAVSSCQIKCLRSS